MVVVNLSDIILGDILVIRYVDELDRLLMIKQNFSNMLVFFDFYFLEYIYYKGYYLEGIFKNCFLLGF